MQISVLTRDEYLGKKFSLKREYEKLSKIINGEKKVIAFLSQSGMPEVSLIQKSLVSHRQRAREIMEEIVVMKSYCDDDKKILSLYYN
jgi:hypothetical protein